MTAPVSLPYEVLPPNRVRRVTARRLRAAVPDKPQVTLHARALVAALLEMRRKLRSAPNPAPVTVTALLAKVLAEALARSNRLNGHIHGDEIRLFHTVNLGVAVDTGSGLVVPVIRAAEKKTISEIARELADLAVRARAGTLSPADLADATFTLSNLGSHGVELFTPLVNPPQIAILGVGATVPGLVLVNGQPEEVPVMGLSLSFDHAAVDGAEAATFLREVVRLVENPAEVLVTNGGGAK